MHFDQYWSSLGAYYVRNKLVKCIAFHCLAEKNLDPVFHKLHRYLFYEMKSLKVLKCILYYYICLSMIILTRKSH
jgi:hypothetical protein